MSIPQGAIPEDGLRRLGNEPLWLPFPTMGSGHAPPIIVRGDGCYLEDVNGKRYLDALAGLFSVNIGYGFGEEIGPAAPHPMRGPPLFTQRADPHPRALEPPAGSAAPSP